MRCPNCGASISENEEKCPYCDSYLEHKRNYSNEQRNNYSNIDDLRRMVEPLRNNPEDKPRIWMILISLFMPVGIMMFIINIAMRRPKSALACFIAGIFGIVKKCAVGEYPKSEIDRYQAA